MKQSLCAIISNVEILPDVNLMWLEASDIAATAQPGQFVTVRCGNLILRRPFSIHRVVVASQSHEPFASCHSEGGERPKNLAQCKFREGAAKQPQIALLFKVAGKGTLWLSQRQKGDKIDVLGPLGKGFSIPSVIARHEVPRQSRNLLLVAGGIGVAPLVFLLQRASRQHPVTLIYGASTARELYPLSFPSGVQLVPVTEDGSVGKKGLVSEILSDFLDWADQIYACGSLGMYKAMALTLNPSPSKGEGKGEGEKRSEESKLKKCQISLEVRMGCGIGACYGCTINTRKGLRKVCRDGPVFELDDILWEEVRI